MLKKALLFFLLFNFYLPAYGAAEQASSLDDIKQLITQGELNRAIAQLQQVVKDDPKHFQAWFLLGVKQAEQRHFDDAIAAFQKVIVLRPKLAEPHNNLAVIYNETGDYRAAVKALEASLALKPGYATAQENIGDLYIKLAADAFRKVLSKHADPALQQRYQRLLSLHSDSNVTSAPVHTTQHQALSGKKHAPVKTTAQVAARPNQTSPNQTVTRPNEVMHQSEANHPTKVIHQTVASKQADTPSEPLSPASKAVLQALEHWRLAWSSKDMAAYFAAYSDEFQYSDRYPTLAKWKDYKTWAMRQRVYIQIDIEHVKTISLADNVIKVTFLQHFKSDTFNSDNRKEMLFRNSDAGWKIIYEASM